MLTADEIKKLKRHGKKFAGDVFVVFHYRASYWFRWWNESFAQAMWIGSDKSDYHTIALGLASAITGCDWDGNESFPIEIL